MLTKSSYAEVVKPLYTLPIFLFSSSRLPIPRLSSLLLPQRLHFITRIHYSWNCQRMVPSNAPPEQEFADKSRETWLIVWKTLAELKGLRELRVAIQLSDEQIANGWVHQVDDEEYILKSLEVARLRNFDKFELIGLPFRTNAPYWWLNESENNRLSSEDWYYS